MLSLLGAVERVRRERIKGASWSMATLAKAIVEDEEAGRISCSDAGKIAETIRSANRTMAPLWLLADAVEEACRSGSTPGDVARRILWYIGEARQMLYHKAAEHVPEGSRIATLSYSSAVETVLTASRPSMVFVAESLPGGEGVELARQLRRAGRSVSLVPDSGLAWAIKESDAVLVGADAVTLDPCLFNKVGSLYAALAASRFGKPFIPVFESYKIHPVVRCGMVEVEVRVYRVEGWGDVVYRVFDRVEEDLVSAALTEYGLVDFKPDPLRDVVDKFLSMVVHMRD